MKILTAVMVIGLLAGCASTAYDKRFTDMDASRAAYKDCLVNNHTQPENCKTEAMIFEADRKALETSLLQNSGRSSAGGGIALNAPRTCTTMGNVTTCN